MYVYSFRKYVTIIKEPSCSKSMIQEVIWKWNEMVLFYLSCHLYFIFVHCIQIIVLFLLFFSNFLFSTITILWKQHSKDKITVSSVIFNFWLLCFIMDANMNVNFSRKFLILQQNFLNFFEKPRKRKMWVNIEKKWIKPIFDSFINFSPNFHLLLNKK